jgi:outer membrane receptor protein involved in Fe transport
MLRPIVRVGIIALPASISLSVHAADSGSSESPALQEIVVTAEKREERLQDVPAAVSALTGATLEAMGAQSFTDYARSIPGLTFTDLGAGRQVPSLRGINPSAGAAAVAYYIDETPIPSADVGVVNPALIDIDRIEVLRGPQGTLYGSSSIGGTIKLISNAPNLSKFQGSVKAEALVTQGADGASPGTDTQLVLNLPIVQDKLAVRGAFYYRDVGGYINRTWTNAGENGIATGPVVGTVGNLPDEHTWGLRATLLFQPTEQFSVSAMAYVQDQHFDGYNDITGGASNPNDQLVQSFISDTPEDQENNFQLYNLTAKYNFGRFNAISSTSYSQQSILYSQEGTSTIQLFPTFAPSSPPSTVVFPNVSPQGLHSYNFTQEVRLATSERIAGFDGVIGAFYSRIHRPFSWFWVPPGYNQVVAGNDPTSPLYAPDNNIFTATGESGYQRELSEFGELTYHFTDALSLTGGLRHYDVSTEQSPVYSGYFIGGNVPGVVSNTTTSDTAKGVVYKGNLSYKLTPDHLLYAQFSEGFRPGFGNGPLPAQCGSTQSYAEVNPDSIKSYELGAKTEWLEKRLTVNAAAYRVNWSKIQQGLFLPCGFFTYANFGDAVVKGGELEVNTQLTNRVSAGLSGTYMNAELQQTNPATGAVAGDQIEYVPNWQGALYGQTTFPLLEAADGFARLEFQYTGSSFANYSRLSDGSRDPAAEMGVVRMLNLRMGMRHQAWDFALSALNLLNETPRQSLDTNAGLTLLIPGRPRYVVVRPRTFSFSVAYQF